MKLFTVGRAASVRYSLLRLGKQDRSFKFLLELAKAPGRARREDKWRNALPLTGRRSRRRSPEILYHQTLRSPGGVNISRKAMKRFGQL